jgi:tetratricopeptide (TPR) repeat protein
MQKLECGDSAARGFQLARECSVSNRGYEPAAVRRSWIAVACLVAVFAAAPRASAQQPPAPAELPAEYRGTDIDRALKAGEWQRAEQLLVSAIDQAPKARGLLEVLGSVFLIERKPLNAAIAFKKAEALGPLDTRSRFALVLAYISLSRGEWARPELERLIAADAGNTTYEYWLGRIDYDAGQYASAARHFEQVIERDPGFVRAYDNLGLCEEALNQPDRAIDHYRKAVELNRTAASPSAWPALNFATLLRHRGDLAEAEGLLLEAIRLDDGMAQAHYQLGVVLEQTARLEDAVRELTRAADLDPSYAAPHYALMRVYRRQGRAADARQALVTFERLHEARKNEMQNEK